jgi:hypothetical protein
MGTYGLEQAIEMWRVGTLTAEQAIGQLLQFIREDRERMNEIERRVARGEGREHTPQMRPAPSAVRNTPDE